MKYFWIILCCLLAGCGVDDTVKNNVPVDTNPLLLGSEQTLEIVTWNIQEFPKLADYTVEYVVDIVKDIDADIYCLQEIGSYSSFNSLNEQLENWNGYKANSASYDIDLAFLYRSDSDLQVISIQELFTDDWYAFPRSPLQLKILWKDQVVYIINNHLKAGGDSDDIERRRLACQNLYEYVNTQLPDEKVIIAGDLNDQLSDSPQYNVFQPILDDSDNFLFADYNIAMGPSSQWSWGNGSSHLDHIIISNELFSGLVSDLASVLTIQVDDHLDGGWGAYNNYVSDHLPVGLKLDF